MARERAALSHPGARYVVQPAARVGGELTVPGDKSISHRALMLGGIADGQTGIHGFLPSEDCHATLAALRAMGAAIETAQGTPPVQIGGGRQLTAIDYVLPVPSAQVKSAILLAGLAAEGVTRVTEPAPTRDHTERMLTGFGAQLQRQGATVGIAGGQRLTATRVEVPADIYSLAVDFPGGGYAAARKSIAALPPGVYDEPVEVQS